MALELLMPGVRVSFLWGGQMYKRVRISWTDSECDNGWFEKEEADKLVNIKDVLTEGYLVKENKKALLISASQCPVGGFLNYTVIPKCCVKSVKRIK